MKYYKTVKDNPFMKRMLVMSSENNFKVSEEDFEKYWFMVMETEEEALENIGSDYHVSENKEMRQGIESSLLVFGDIVENYDGKWLLGFGPEYPEVFTDAKISKMEKYTKTEAKYQPESLVPGRQCSQCTNFLMNECAVVEGKISALAWCAFYIQFDVEVDMKNRKEENRGRGHSKQKFKDMEKFGKIKREGGRFS